MGSVLSLSRSCLFLFLVTGLQTDKEPYRAKVPCLFLEPPALIPNFAYECQYFFLEFFLRSASPPQRRRAPLSQMLHSRADRRGLLFALLRQFR